MKANLLIAFLPAVVVWPVWIYCMTVKGVWSVAFGRYYPMTCAMIIGCFIAGSTPLGGAVTAFPVAVLVLKFTPVQGRDFSILIQSIGMTAAAYLITIRKKHLVKMDLVQVGCVANTFGIILGVSIELPGFWVNVTYMTYTMAFAFLLLYKHMVAGMEATGQRARESIAREHALNKAIDDVKNEAKELESQGKHMMDTARYQDPCTVMGNIGQDDVVDKEKKASDDIITTSVRMPLGLTIGLGIFGIIGGALTSKIGSGSDTLLYVFGIFLYNSFMDVALPESMLTATSVIVMAFSTVVMSIIRLVQGGIADEVYLCWGAVLWLVVMGAPIGSFVLNKNREAFFRRLFYCLAVIQFITFALLKIKARIDAWICVAAILAVTFLGMALHMYSALVLKCLCGYGSMPDRSHSDQQSGTLTEATDNKIAQV